MNGAVGGRLTAQQLLVQLSRLTRAEAALLSLAGQPHPDDRSVVFPLTDKKQTQRLRRIVVQIQKEKPSVGLAWYDAVTFEFNINPPKVPVSIADVEHARQWMQAADPRWKARMVDAVAKDWLAGTTDA